MPKGAGAEPSRALVTHDENDHVVDRALVAEVEDDNVVLCQLFNESKSGKISDSVVEFNENVEERKDLAAVVKFIKNAEARTHLAAVIYTLS